jgi:hypothetical protein
MNEQSLYMLLVGCKPPGRNTEQHDVFFTIGGSLPGLVPAIKNFWPQEGKGLHLDAWRKVGFVDGFSVKVQPKASTSDQTQRLYFINLGGYKKGEFEEFHYKILIAAPSKEKAIQKAKETAFFKHTGFKGATAHVDDKYGIDVDDINEIAELLAPGLKERYTIVLEPATEVSEEDPVQLGYFPLASLV